MTKEFKNFMEEHSDYNPNEKPLKEPKKEIKNNPLPTTKINRNQAIKEFNQNPNTKKAGVIAIKKENYIGVWIAFGLIFLLLAVSFIWFNISFTKKDFTPNVNITNNLPETKVEINPENNYENFNNHTINLEVNVEIDEQISDIIADRVLDIINNETS